MINGREELLHHEGGHFAAAVLLGLRVKAVLAVPGRGAVLVETDRNSASAAVKQAMVILSGMLEVLPWHEVSRGRLNPERSSDDRDLLKLIERWGIDAETYDKLVSLTMKLRATREFDRLVDLTAAVLDDRLIIDERQIEVMAA